MNRNARTFEQSVLQGEKQIKSGGSLPILTIGWSLLLVVVVALPIRPGATPPQPLQHPTPQPLKETGTASGAVYARAWGLVQIQAPAAWATVNGSPQIVIADVGSGVDLSHPDLADQLWVNPGEISGNGLDDDGNGCVDDLHGWNVVDHNSDLRDATGHSTAMAGILAGAPNKVKGTAGVCWGCRLMIVRVTQADGLAYYSAISRGVAYAARNGADVINISLRGRLDLIYLRSAIAEASQTAVVVSGAGNDWADSPVYPAAYDGVLAVASTDIHDVKPDESNYGAWVDVAAPGKDALTTSVGGGYRARSGTSVASAYAAGLAGLVRSRFPDCPPDVVRAQIVQTADDIDSQNPSFEGLMGSGRINAARAVRGAVQRQPAQGGDVPAVRLCGEWDQSPRIEPG